MLQAKSGFEGEGRERNPGRVMEAMAVNGGVNVRW